MKKLPANADCAMRIYRRLLRLYPNAFRRRFGPEMEHDFEKLLSETWAARPLAGRALFLGRAAADILETAMTERLRAGFAALARLGPIAARARIQWSAAVGVSIAAASLFVIALINFSLPVRYRAVSRLRVDPQDEQKSAVHSGQARAGGMSINKLFTDADLKTAIQELGLASRWSSRLGISVQDADALAILKRNLAIERYRSTSIASISAYDSDPQLAADIANWLARFSESRAASYSKKHPAQAPVVVLIDAARPEARPASPNLVANLVLGLVLATALGVATAAAAWVFLGRMILKRGGPPHLGEAGP